MRNLFLLIILITGTRSTFYAQNSEFSSGLLPSITFSTPITENFQLTAKIESMQEMFSNSFENGDYFEYSYKRTDLQGFIAYKINPFWSAAAGYQHRLVKANDNAHRTIQQLALVQRKTGYRLAHRLRMDQTFQDSESTEYRFRYRLSAEVALQGLEVDTKEFYLLISDEPIFNLQGDEQDIENRLGTSLGYYYSSRQRFEAGLDFRTDKILLKGGRNRLWINLGWKIKI